MLQVCKTCTFFQSIYNEETFNFLKIFIEWKSILPIHKVISAKRVRPAFTMVEMAIVIVIIAILAAIAIPRIADSTRAAQVSVVKDFLMKLKTAAGLYASKNQKMPTSFAVYVTTQPLDEAAMPDMFLSLSQLGTGTCTVSGTTITCPATAFPELGAFSYQYNSPTEIVLNCPICYQ